MKKSDCNRCICKTCAIAYENSGAEGCGDCTKCKEEKWDTVNGYPMYYNPTEKSRQMTHFGTDLCTIWMTMSKEEL